jgi:predicted DNA-binding transcriptional regulator YafY
MAGRMGKPRASGHPAPATVRKIGILLDLVRHRAISLRACETLYGASERTVLRDLQELRKIGKTTGFTISDRTHGDTFSLSKFDARPANLVAGEKRLRALMSELFRAFGGPVGDIAKGLDSGDGNESFLQFVLPKLVAQAAVTTVFEELEKAWSNCARVEFTYKGERRTVEPAIALVRSGRYYLVGRDVKLGRNGWRNFAMDLIVGPVTRAGTFTRTKPPARYLSTDAIGFFKGDGPLQTVDVTFSKTVGEAAASRQWQIGQKVRRNTDGTVTISLEVNDIDEVVRWALSYGGDAWIAAPASAVAKAKGLVERLEQRYR